MKKFVKLPALKLNKETVAKLTDAKMNEIKGGVAWTINCPTPPVSLKFDCTPSARIACPLYGIDPDVE